MSKVQERHKQVWIPTRKGSRSRPLGKTLHRPNRTL